MRTILETNSLASCFSPPPVPHSGRAADRCRRSTRLRIADAQAALRPRSRRATHYNAGVRCVEKADELTADAAHQADERKQQKAARQGAAGVRQRR